MDSSLREERKIFKNSLFYLPDLYSNFNKTQKNLQGKDVTITQARTILLEFQGQLSLLSAPLSQ